LVDPLKPTVEINRAAANSATVIARSRLGVSQVVCRVCNQERTPVAPVAAAMAQAAHMATAYTGPNNAQAHIRMTAWTAISAIFCVWTCPGRKSCAQADSRLDPRDADALAAGVRALANPTRLTLVMALRDGGELCGCDLSWVVERSQALVSHHLRSLRSAGVVQSRREGKMVIYALTSSGQRLLNAVVASQPQVLA
jgi:DNA-binding transcriptional ArsR family regulator